MRLKVSILWIALSIVFPGAASLNATDRIPRKWTEMSMEDIDPFPFTWAPGGSVCRVTENVALRDREGCYLDLRAPASWEQTGYLDLGIVVEWLVPDISPTGPECESYCGIREREPEGGVLGIDRVIITYESPTSPVSYKDRRKAFPLDEVTRIMRDITMRLEGYAPSCDCGTQQLIGNAAGDRPQPAGSGSWSIPGSVEAPTGTIETPPHLLGQGDANPNNLGSGGSQTAMRSESRAMRRDSGGFPPGVKVTSLTFFQGSGEAVERGARAYDNRFSDRAEYINFELNLAYPAREERFPFEVTAVISKEGNRFATFTQGGLSLEPGWVTSYHNGGWGRVGGGIWTPGSYRVELSVKGEVVATGTFQVVASER